MGKSDGITILSRIFYIYIFTQEKSFSSYKKDGLTWGRELIPLALQRSFWLSSRKLKSLIWGLSHVQVTEYMAKNLNDLCGVFLKLQLRLLNTRPSASLFLFFFFFSFFFDTEYSFAITASGLMWHPGPWDWGRDDGVRGRN